MTDSSVDGYVKYTAEHTPGPAIKTSEGCQVPGWAELNDARSRLRQLGLVGQNSNGIGFGNLSIRCRGNEFLITGTATGALPELSPNGYCLIKSFDPVQNRVVSEGPVPASSESMTHGAIYESCPGANCVIHIHSRAIFDGMIRDNAAKGGTYPATPENAAFGTPEIAFAIAQCVKDINKNEGTIVLAGHDEGVISYGPSVEKALNLILELNHKYGG